MRGFVSHKILRRKCQTDLPLSEPHYILQQNPLVVLVKPSSRFMSHCVRLLFVADYGKVVQVCVKNVDGFSSGRAQRRGMQRVSRTVH